jgi:uncharacterized iron-regulated membrane protein
LLTRLTSMAEGEALRIAQRLLACAPWMNGPSALRRCLHGGPLPGMPGRIAVFLAGLALPLLVTTSLRAWLGRQRAQWATQASYRRALAGPRPVLPGGEASLGK